MAAASTAPPPAAPPSAPPPPARQASAPPAGKAPPAAAPPAGEPADPYAESFSALGKFTKSDKGLPEARPNEPPRPPGAPKPKVDPARPGEQGVNDPTAEELAEGEAQAPKEDEQTTEQPDQQPPKEKDEEPRVDEKGRRRNPWDLVNNYRSRNRELTKEIDELRSKGGTNGEPPAEWKAKFEAVEKRNKELEDEIGFTNYTKSKEFIEKYQNPYMNAYKEAAYALSGLKVRFEKTDPETGETAVTQRDLTQDDITILANMKPEDARIEMKMRFPEDWVEVKTHVDKVRALANAQNAHLEERRKNGGEWQRQQQEQRTQFLQNMVAENRKVWGDLLAEDVKKFEFLRPVEGDTARNERLEKATQFVEEALKVNAMDPRLSPEQRREVLRKHVAMRNRAIGFSVLNHENKTLKAKVAELEKSLKQYAESEPAAGEGRGREGTAREVSTLDEAAAGLLKYAK